MPDKFTYVKRGYDPAEVDEYIDTLENVLKSYKEKDNAIKNAIINAQIAADNILRNSELAAEESKREAAAQLTYVYESVAQQKLLLKNFQREYNEMINKYVVQFNEKDLINIYSRINELEEYLVSLTENIQFRSVE